MNPYITMKPFDFENDLKTEIQKFAEQFQFRISSSKSFENILLDYLTVRVKIIKPKSRHVHKSAQLVEELRTHPKKKVIQEIFSRSLSGYDLNCFLSKRALQSNFHDHLQNEWSIYHFHLSLEKEQNSRFVKQVDSLLFAFITETDIFFLGTETHKEGIFGDIKWLEILHDNFPNAIEKYKADYISDVYPEVNSVERQTLWDKGYTLGVTKVRGNIYFGPGMGRVTSGHSVDVIRTVDKVIEWLETLKKQISNYGVEICNSYDMSPEKVEFKIIFGQHSLELIEANSRKRILSFPCIFMQEGRKI